MQGCMACKGGYCKAHGGEVGDSGFSDDMIDRIMRHKFSEGGEVANKTEIVADFEPAEYDELGKTGGLEDFSYDGENSGDEIGDAAEDEDRMDMIGRIMRSRMKKDKNPRPA